MQPMQGAGRQTERDTEPRWVCPFNVNGECDLPHDDCFCGLPWVHRCHKGEG